MSRIGRKPIPLPKGVTVTVNGDDVTVKGPKGSLDFKVLPGISVEVKEDQVMVSRSSDEKAMRAAHGMTRAIINNMVVGVSQGFEKQLG